ncbi:MAG TPA: hypothetical protein VMW70_07060 [Burkholderiales bacterium]|nr:hypothetical protein [Burkholderiales bacterium]
MKTRGLALRLCAIAMLPALITGVPPAADRSIISMEQNIATLGSVTA